MTPKTSFAIAGILFLAGIALGAFLLGIDRPYAAGISPIPQNLAATGQVPTRIVCVTPIGTEAVFALGAQGQLVGVSDFCDEPPDAKSIPRVGGEFNPNFERLAVLAPDLIIGLGRCENLDRFCEHYNVRMLHVAMANLQSLYDDLHQLGRVLGRSATADALCDKIQNDLAAIQTLTSRAERRPRVLFVLYRRDDTLAGLTTAATGTTHDDLIRIAGGENIFGDLAQPYPQVSKESLLARQPEIIIEPRTDLDENTRQRLLAGWRLIPGLPAVENNKIFFLPADLILQTGPRVPLIAKEFARIIHPELFDD